MLPNDIIDKLIHTASKSRLRPALNLENDTDEIETQIMTVIPNE